jgi:hypothetical protein
MSDNVTPIRPDPPQPDDRFDRIYDGMQAQLDALRCASAVFAESGEVDCEEDLSAANSLLRRTILELDRLHTELADWHMAQSRARSS